MATPDLHPADELADITAAGTGDPRRMAELVDLLVSSRENRVGTRFHAVVTRTPDGDVVETRPLPTLEEYLDLLTGPLLVVDTETTGLHPLLGDRLLSVAAVKGEIRAHGEELAFERTDEPYLALVNPGVASSQEALAVHGLTPEMLHGRPTFGEIALDVDRVLYDQVVVAHNAPFDVGFLDAEFERTFFDGVSRTARETVDTRVVSKLVWPGEPASLDPMAIRLGVDRGRRDELHDALEDADLLARCIPGLVREIRIRLGLERSPERDATAPGA